MKKAKILALSNFIIIAVVTIVAIIGFAPEKSVTISGTQKYQAIYKGSSNSGGVALMINVYENAEVTKKMVELLQKNNAKATFFIGGSWADDNVETLKLIIESGFEVGNHGYFHKDHKLISETANRNEIKNCNDLVYKLTGYKMTLFAPPSGSFSNATLKVASELNMSTIMWSKDTIDWRDNDKSIIISRATSGVNSGDLILMHPKEHTLAVMQDIIDKIKGNGLELLTVSECAMLSTVVV